MCKSCVFTIELPIYKANDSAQGLSTSQGDARLAQSRILEGRSSSVVLGGVNGEGLANVQRDSAVIDAYSHRIV